MFDNLIELFNHVVFLKHCYKNYIPLIERVKGRNSSYFYFPLISHILPPLNISYFYLPLISHIFTSP